MHIRAPSQKGQSAQRAARAASPPTTESVRAFAWMRKQATPECQSRSLACACACTAAAVQTQGTLQYHTKTTYGRLTYKTTASTTGVTRVERSNKVKCTLLEASSSVGTENRPTEYKWSVKLISMSDLQTVEDAYAKTPKHRSHNNEYGRCIRGLMPITLALTFPPWPWHPNRRSRAWCR